MGAREKPTWFDHEREYRNQMKAIREICDELGLVMYYPDYHAKHDPNTVLIYFKEDAEYNRKLEAKWAPLNPMENEYRGYIYAFTNTDANVRYDPGFAEHGRIDLRGLDYASRIKGAIRLAYLTKMQDGYVVASGGYLGIRESDDEYNDYNRLRIEAMREKYGEVWLGNVNYYGDERKAVSDGSAPVFTKWDGSKIYNFSYSIAAPKNDEKLCQLIREWNTVGWSDGVQKIMDRVGFIGGINLIWY